MLGFSAPLRAVFNVARTFVSVFGLGDDEVVVEGSSGGAEEGGSILVMVVRDRDRDMFPFAAAAVIVVIVVVVTELLETRRGPPRSTVAADGSAISESAEVELLGNGDAESSGGLVPVRLFSPARKSARSEKWPPATGRAMK